MAVLTLTFPKVQCRSPNSVGTNTVVQLTGGRVTAVNGVV